LQIFKLARGDERTGYHAYVAAALMERTGKNGDKVAGNVFELGLKRFPSEPGYILAYLKFLLGINEHTNIRVLFERAISGLPGESCPWCCVVHLAT
jgi:cleavage stimulation factor subunit 3